MVRWTPTARTPKPPLDTRRGALVTACKGRRANLPLMKSAVGGGCTLLPCAGFKRAGRGTTIAEVAHTTTNSTRHHFRNSYSEPDSNFYARQGMSYDYFSIKTVFLCFVQTSSQNVSKPPFSQLLRAKIEPKCIKTPNFLSASFKHRSKKYKKTSKFSSALCSNRA